MTFNLPKIIGHRGVRALAPENTTHSIIKAIEYNLKWVEIDVKVSKDKVPFLLHDDLLDRTTSGKGYPYKYSFKYIQNLDAGTWFDPKLSYLHPPTLKEVLDLCSKKDIGVNIELKPNKEKEKENVEAISNLIQINNFNCQYFFSSFDFFSIKLMRNCMPNSYLGYLIDDFNKNKNFFQILDICLSIECFCIGLNVKLINKEIVKTCKDNNLKITAYSDKNINLNKAKRLWSLGVDSVFIDNPYSYFKTDYNLE